MIYLAYLLESLACIASGTYLIATGHYGWAWIPFLIAATMTVRSKG